MEIWSRGLIAHSVFWYEKWAVNDMYAVHPNPSDGIMISSLSNNLAKKWLITYAPVALPLAGPSAVWWPVVDGGRWGEMLVVVPPPCTHCPGCIIVCNNQLFTWPATTHPATLQPLLSWKSLPPPSVPWAKLNTKQNMSMVFQQLGELSVRGVGPKKLVSFSRPNLKSSTRNREARKGGTRSGRRVDIVLLGQNIHSCVLHACMNWQGWGVKLTQKLGQQIHVLPNIIW